MYLRMTECHLSFLDQCDLDLNLFPSFKNDRFQKISFIFFEVGIPDLVCGCILGWRSVASEAHLALA